MLSKFVANVLAAFLTVMSPVALLLTPGYLVLLVLSPFGLIFLTPLIILYVNHTYTGRLIPMFMSWMQVLFFVLWSWGTIWLVSANSESSGIAEFLSSFGINIRESSGYFLAIVGMIIVVLLTILMTLIITRTKNSPKSLK